MNMAAFNGSKAVRDCVALNLMCLDYVVCVLQVLCVGS